MVENLTPRAQPDPATQPLPGVVLATPTVAPTPTNAPTLTPPPPVAEEREPEPTLSAKDIRRIAKWTSLNARCQLAGPSEDRWNACADRDELAAKMRDKGLCYGGGDATAGGWHACD